MTFYFFRLSLGDRFEIHVHRLRDLVVNLDAEGLGVCLITVQFKRAPLALFRDAP